MERVFRKLIAPLKRRVMLMIGRAVLTAVNDSPKLQTVQLDGLAGEVLDDLERFQQYGFTSVPNAGAEAIVVFLGGNRSHGIAINVDDRKYRLTGLANGEVALYDDSGNVVHLMNGGKMKHIAPTKITFDTPLAEFTGDVEVPNGDVTASGISQVHHTHPDPQGGSVGEPT